jgi:hypothetical protein
MSLNLEKLAVKENFVFNENLKMKCLHLINIVMKALVSDQEVLESISTHFNCDL